jgi:protein-S-isoprenylcysteine O-methyltransferase Ste14
MNVERPSTIQPSSQAREGLYFNLAYRVFAYYGLMAVFGSLLFGFAHDAAAPASNFRFNLLLYAAFVAPHLVMTRPWFKRAVWGNPAGSPAERRVYIAIAVVTWLAVLALHRPVPGGEVELPHWLAVIVHFSGVVGFLYCFFLFVQGATLNVLDGLLGVPGAAMSFSHGPETPLFTDGPYAEVRHPMYRAALLAGLSSLLIYPNAGQLLWAVLIAVTFIGFIPVEEAQLIRARGDDYRRYRERTPYRLIKGIW